MARRRLAALLLCALALGGCSSGDRRQPPRVTDVDSQGPFSLALTVQRTQFQVHEAITAVATFAYAGPKAWEELSGSGSGPILFGIEQGDGPIDAGFWQTDDCKRHVLERDGPLVLAFRKGAAFSANDPMADFWRAYVADPELRLPAGHDRLTALVELAVGQGCDGPPLDLRASVEITVR
jgi:hypothetical protein